MNSKISRIIIFSFLLVFSTGLYAQTTISGTIYDSGNGEPLIGVNILVKGTVLGTTTDVNGNFNLRVSSDPPFILTISSIGYERKEVEITQSNVSGLEVELQESLLLGQEVVVSASRVEESILESPVSIEKMDILDVQSTSADTYYKAIANLKGVDVTTSSINFQIINARGFSNTGNTRFVQLIDGMDTQAPALNFPIGNLNGPSELDVESVELIPGASSALYGPAAFNGVLLINSKNAFDYQGLSAFVKMGVNHVGQNADRDISPMYEGSIRYAKAFNNKFAFKVNGSYSRANDWHVRLRHGDGPSYCFIRMDGGFDSFDCRKILSADFYQKRDFYHPTICRTKIRDNPKNHSCGILDFALCICKSNISFVPGRKSHRYYFGQWRRYNGF